MKKSLLCCLLCFAGSIPVVGQATVTLQPPTDTVPLRIGPGVSPAMSDLLDIFCNTSLTGMPCFSVLSTGTFTFSGNTVMYGTTGQVSPSWIELFGGSGPDAYLEETSAGTPIPSFTSLTFSNYGTGGIPVGDYVFSCITYVVSGVGETSCSSPTAQAAVTGSTPQQFYVPYPTSASGSGTIAATGWNYYACLSPSSTPCSPLLKQNGSTAIGMLTNSASFHSICTSGTYCTSPPLTNTANLNLNGYWFISPTTGYPCFSSSVPTGECPTGSQLAQVAGDLGNTAPSPQVISTHLTSPLPFSQGGLASTASPTSAQIPVANSGATAYVPQSMTGDCTIASSGAITCTAANGGAFPASAVVLGTNSSKQPAATTTTGTGSTVVLAGGPMLNNPVVGTQSASDNSTKAASTAYVKSQSWPWSGVYLGSFASTAAQGSQWTTPAALTWTSLDVSLVTAPATCGTNPIFALYDQTTSTTLLSVTFTNGTSVYTTTGSSNSASGDVVVLKNTRGAATCGTIPGQASVTATYKYQ